MKTAEQITENNKLIADFMAGYSVQSHHNQYHTSWSELIPVIKKLDSWANEEMTFEEFDDYRTSQWRMINNPSKYDISDVHRQVVQFIKHYDLYQKQAEQFQVLKEKHEKLRNILIEYDAPEHGDCIIDEISELFGEQPTTVYYEE